MDEQKLDYDEVVLVEPFYVSLEEKKNNKGGHRYINGELMLTNKYLVWSRDAKWSLFNGKQTFPIEKFRVDSIKIYDGVPQIKIHKAEFDNLLIYLKNRTMSFEFYELEPVQKLINATSKLLTGNEVLFETPDTFKGVDKLASKMSGTVNTFKNAFGIKPERNEIVTKTCQGCGAQISGIKGQSVKCKYCDNQQIL